MLGLRERMEENGSAPGTGEAKRSAAAPADPEVVDRPLRRRFSPSYKLRIVEEADRCTEPGEVGQVLRREGLYSSHLTTWRKAAHSGSLKALSKKRGRKPERNPLDEKVRKLERRNARLENELRKAHLIIDVQGKVAGLGWTPTSLAMRRQLQCVASAGFSSRVLRTISASSSGVILRGRPERGRSSSSSSTPPASYRSSHCVTVGLDTPTSRQIADPDRPSAEQRTMLALSTTRCGVVRLFTNRSKRLRSPRRNRILRTGSPMRRIYRMYLLCKRFLLHYTSSSFVRIMVQATALPEIGVPRMVTRGGFFEATPPRRTEVTMSRARPFATLLTVSLLSACAGSTPPPAAPLLPEPEPPAPVEVDPGVDYDLIIENGRVVDGTGSAWFYGDVAVKDGRIARITPGGLLSGATATMRVNAVGHVVSPGFIDIQS